MGVAPIPAPQCLFGATWSGGERFSPEKLSASPPPPEGPGTHVDWAQGWGGRGSMLGRGGDVHVAPASSSPASGVGAGAALPGTGCVSAGPAISDPAGGPWPGTEVGAARVNFAQSLGVFFFTPALVRGASQTADGEGLSRCADGRVCWGGLEG